MGVFFFIQRKKEKTISFSKKNIDKKTEYESKNKLLSKPQK